MFIIVEQNKVSQKRGFHVLNSKLKATDFQGLVITW